jgi:hypothetical protein
VADGLQADGDFLFGMQLADTPMQRTYYTNFEFQTPVDYNSPGRDLMFPNDSWFDWQPDPERAFREHDPTAEPHASMSRDEILTRMRDARGGREWEFLREFLIDKCTQEELRYDRFMSILEGHGALGSEELAYLGGESGMATRLLLPSPSSSTRGPDDSGG